MRTRIAILGLVLVAACSNEDDKEVLPPVVLGMSETIAPTYDDGETKIYEVQQEVRLPFRRPEDGERPKGELAPYPRIPFHVTTNSHITVRYALTNLEDKPHNIDILIDPWNEFVRYVPGVTEADEKVQPNFSGIQRTVVLQPKARLEGIITPDDMNELARDLTVAMALAQRPPDVMGAFGGPVLFNRTFNQQNRSSEPDPVLVSWMPKPDATIAAITGFDLGLRTYEQAKIAIELVIDVEDLDGNRVVMEGDDQSKKLGRPGQELTPPAGAAP